MRRVLIADDEPWAREAVKSLGAWGSLGLQVAGEAEDGTQALSLIAERHAEIVVTDMRMPGIDGVELLQAMHKGFPGLKIIVMSGYDDFVYLKQAIRSQVLDYLLKPIDPAELNAALERAVQELARAHGEAGTDGSGAAVSVDTAAENRSRNRLDLGEVQAYIDRHFTGPISLETIAHRFFVSKEHLSRTFKAYVGENISDYILRRRMEKARELLVGQGLAIKHVAEITGYADLAYFYRVFKRHFGVTPGELRGDE